MKKISQKILSCFLAFVMLFGIAPLGAKMNLDSVVTADAASMAGYNRVAAAQWAKSQLGSRTSVLFGTRYWYDGGDCANFVSEALYMGGLEPSVGWNHNGYLAHMAVAGVTNGAWIRVEELHDHLVSIGAKDIVNPSPSQIEIGDVILYKNSDNKWQHSSIVVEANGTSAKVAAHSTNLINYIKEYRDLGFGGSQIHLMKMQGSTCTANKVRDIYVYRGSDTASVYSNPSKSSTRLCSGTAGDYVHVSEKRTVNGVEWGYVFEYNMGNMNFFHGWVMLNQMTYKGHYTTGPINHLFGDWFVSVQPTCRTKGEEKRVCSRCGYTETRPLAIGGEHMSVVDATCTNSSYCKACGKILSDPLGHNWSGWIITVTPTCTLDGTEKRTCHRCSLEETRTVEPLGHDYAGVSSLAGCVTTGTSVEQCSRCGDKKIVSSDWSAFTVIDVNDSKYSEFIGNPDLSKSREEYRYRDKSFTTSTSTDSMSGWTKYGTDNVSYGSYGSWSSWSDSRVTSSDTREVQTQQVNDTSKPIYNTKTVYHYYRYGTAQWSGYGNGCKTSSYPNYYTYDSDVELTQTSATSTSSAENGTQGYKMWHSGSTPNYNTQKDNYITVWKRTTFTTQENTTIKGYQKKTQYRYRDRTKTITRHFYQWPDWSLSNWTTTKQTPTDNKQEQTRTTYSFKQAALGHDWGEPVVIKPTCHENGCTRRTCRRCGAVYDTNVTQALGDKWGEWYLTSEEGVSPKIYRRDCVQNCGCHCGHYQTKIEECTYEKVSTTVPTCTQKGYSTYQCTIHSNESYTADFVDELNHLCDNQWVVTTAPTCTQNGVEECHCVRFDNGVTCDKTYTREIEKTGHNLVKTDAVNRTCLKDGNIEYYTCQYCHKIFADSTGSTELKEKDIITKATGHNGKNANNTEVWVCEVSNGCGITGIEKNYCQNAWCDIVEDCDKCQTTHHATLKVRETPEITPDYYIRSHTDPTCTSCGMDEWTCRNCEGTDHEHGWSEILSRLPHPFGESEIIYATCTEGGYERKTCSVCGLIAEMGTSDGTGHSTSPKSSEYASSTDKMELVSSIKNECGSGSVDTYQCTHIDQNTGKRCTYTEVIGTATEHTLGDYIVTKQPTCSEDGYKHRECTNGDYRTADEPIPAIGHDYQLVKTVDARCTTPSYEEYVCSHDSSHKYEIQTGSPLGHDYGAWIDDGNGKTHTKTCQRTFCDETVTEHKVGENHHFTKTGHLDPKCKEDGYNEYTCSDCSYKYREPISQTDHDWGDWFVTVESTINNKGEEKRICKNDSSHTQRRETPIIESYTATFMISDKVIDVVRFAKDTKSIVNPTVEEKANYTFSWDDYELKNADIVIHGHYDPINPDDISDIKTEKKAEYRDGTASITLSATAATKTIKYTSKSQKPYDFIFVLDASGSMNESLDSRKTKIDALKDTATDFVNKIYTGATENDIDYRVAVVTFGGSDKSSSRYVNTAVLSTNGFVKINSSSYSKSIKTAMMDVTDKRVFINNAINNIEPSGATAAHLGLQMARDIISENIDSDRQRVVIFITDGVPTHTNANIGNESKVTEVAQLAITAANSLKQPQIAQIYSIGVHPNCDVTREFSSSPNGIDKALKGSEEINYDFNRFLHLVSSNYPSSKAMDDYGEGSKENGYYMSVNSTEALEKSLNKIMLVSTTKQCAFERVTLFDTLTNAFTLTIEQEQQLRARLNRELGLTDNDIEIDRNDDGTTTVRFDNVPAKKTYDSLGNSYYKASVTFDVSANGKALNQGKYYTNTENAGVKVNDEEIAKFDVPSINIPSDRNVYVFKINGETYRISDGNIGDKIVVPDTDLAKWNVDSNAKITERYAEFEASEVSENEYTVTFIVDGVKTVNSYKYGDMIFDYDGPVPEGKMIKSWSPAVKKTMPNYNVSYTANLTENHTHQFEEKTHFSSQTDMVTYVYKCTVCGIEKEETKQCEHRYKAVVSETSSGKDLVVECISCSVCGKSNNHQLTFSAKYSKSGRTYVCDLNYYKDNLKTRVQPDGTIAIMVYLGDKINKNYKVYRINPDGTKTEYPSAKENGYLVFEADHFSTYVLSELDENGTELEQLKYKDTVCIFNGHEYADTVIYPTCTEKGYTIHTCSVCADEYADSYTDALGHTDEKDHDQKCDRCGSSDVKIDALNCSCICHKALNSKFYKVLYKICRVFWRLFSVRRNCKCGHYHY